jgi:hypothetical protein
MDKEQGLSKRVSELEQKLDDYKVKEAEVKRRATEKVKKGRTLDSKAITELKQAKERIDELENEILELEQNRDDFSDLLKAEEIEHASTKRKLNNAIEAAETLNTRLETAESEANNHKNRADVSEGVIRLRDQKITNLEREKAESEGGKLYQFTVWVGKKTGISDLWNAVSNIAMIIGLLVILLGVSWLWKYLIRPMIKNFTAEPKPKKEPEPTPTAAINQNQPPIIIIPPQHQIPPTNNYQALPPQEIIEVETPKPIEEKVREISPKNSKKGKASKKKPKNKK